MNREQKIMTRQELSAFTGIPLESVCGRVNELMQRSAVEVCGFRHCAETGKDREVLRVRKAGRVTA